MGSDFFKHIHTSTTHHRNLSSYYIIGWTDSYPYCFTTGFNLKFSFLTLSRGCYSQLSMFCDDSSHKLINGITVLSLFLLFLFGVAICEVVFICRVLALFSLDAMSCLASSTLTGLPLWRNSCPWWWFLYCYKLVECNIIWVRNSDSSLVASNLILRTFQYDQTVSLVGYFVSMQQFV